MEPKIIDYYNENPHMMNIIDNMNEEYDDLYNENYILKKQIEILKNKYEPLLSLDKLINNSIRFQTHYDVARVIYEIHCRTYKCTSIKNKTWYYRNKYDEWVLSDNNVHIRTAISDSRNIYEQKLINLKKSLEELDPETESFWIREEIDIPNCEFIIEKFNKPRFSSYVLRECMDFFYDGV